MRRSRCCLLTMGIVAILFNLHLLLLGSPLINCIFSSKAFAALNNLIVPMLSSAMRAQGVPVGGNRSEVYAHTPSGQPLRVDVYEPPSYGDTARPAVLYFHAGAFNSLGRELCGGHLCWLASHGVVGFSASYRLTNSRDGAGVAACIDDAWSALAWLRINAKRLRVDPKRIVVWGDSAGGGLALALGTGLRPSNRIPAPRHELPAAVLAGFPVTTFGSKTFLTIRRPASLGTSTWMDTPAMSQIAIPNLFVPAARGTTAEATQATIRSAFSGGNLFFGQRSGGLLPADGLYPLSDDAASVSPLSLAKRKRLPPVLIFSAANDTVVPLGQQERFAYDSRRAGNKVAQIIFDGADHGEGGVYTPAGREATLRFLDAHGLLPGARVSDEGGAGVDCLEGARRALSLNVPPFPKKSGWRWWKHKRRTLWLQQIVA